MARSVKFQISSNVQLVTLNTPGYSQPDQAEQVPETKPNSDARRSGSQTEHCQDATRTISQETELNISEVICQSEQMPGTELNSDARRRGGQDSQETELNTNAVPGTKLNPDAGGRGSQVSQETEPNTTAVTCPKATECGQASDRAEQRMTGCPGASSSHQGTLLARQCHTKQWPVARLVDLPVDLNIVPPLTTYFGKERGRADQMSRAELCSTNKRLKEEDLQDKSLDLRQNRIAMNEGKQPSLSMRRPPSNQEYSRRQEDSTRKETTNRKEETSKEGNLSQEKSLKTCWKEIRMSRGYIIANSDGWKELDGKETRRLEKEEKKLKSELVERKKKKYGKAGKTKLTRMEEALISSNTGKLMEMEEIKLNLQQEQAIQEGRKLKSGWKKLNGEKQNMKKVENSVAEHWQILATRMEMIDKNEEWLDAGWLEKSSLEEQRCILNASGHKTRLSASIKRYSESLIEDDQIKRYSENLIEDEIDKKGGRKVSQLAGLFQRDGKNARGMDGGRERATALRGEHGGREVQVHGGGHRDADEHCEENLENYKKKTTTSLEGEFDLAEEPQFDRKTSLLRQEYNFMFGRKEDFVVVDTHAENQVTSSSSGNVLRGKMSEMHSPSLATHARALIKSEMHCQERSPGGGKISKCRRGTPKKNSRVNSIRKLFENISPANTGGNIELLLQSSKLTNLNLAENQFITRQKELICVDQPGRGLQTGPGETCGLLFRPNSDWQSQPDLGETSQSDKLSHGQPGYEWDM